MLFFFFQCDDLDDILDLIESVSEGFPTYSLCMIVYREWILTFFFGRPPSAVDPDPPPPQRPPPSPLPPPTPHFSDFDFLSKFTY